MAQQMQTRRNRQASPGAVAESRRSAPSPRTSRSGRSTPTACGRPAAAATRSSPTCSKSSPASCAPAPARPASSATRAASTPPATTSTRGCWTRSRTPRLRPPRSSASAAGARRRLPGLRRRRDCRIGCPGDRAARRDGPHRRLATLAGGPLARTRRHRGPGRFPGPAITRRCQR